MKTSTPAPETQSDFQPRGGIGGLVVFIVISLICLALAMLTQLKQYLQVEQIEKLAASLGFWGPFAIIFAGIATPLIFLPRWPIASVAGLLYGVVWGSVLANIASTVGAWLHFFLARTLLSKWTTKWRHRYGIHPSQAPQNRIFAVLCLLRAFPLSNFVATNLLAGALNIRMRTYLAATFLGMIPSTIMYAALGKLMKKPSLGHTILAFTIFLALLIGTLLARKRFAPWFKRVSKPMD